MATAERLCTALDADSRQFYLHLLKDLLPEDVFETLVRPLPLESFGNLRERQKMLDHDLAIYKEAFAKARLAESYVPTKEAVTLFTQRPELLPLLHFIYLVDDAHENDVAIIMQKNNIPGNACDIMDMFLALGIVEPAPSPNNFGKAVRRLNPIFRLPLDDLGYQLKKTFVIKEVAQSLDLNRGPHLFSSESFIEAKIESYERQDVDRIRGRILDLLAETVAASNAPDANAEVYFLSVIVSPRKNYTSIEEEKAVGKNSKTKKGD